VGLPRGSLARLALGVTVAGLIYRGATCHCSVYQALGVNTAQPRNPASSIPATEGVKVEKTITINRSPEELYRFWHNLENLPRFMKHLESVRLTGGNRSHWIAKGPLGTRFEWDAAII